MRIDVMVGWKIGGATRTGSINAIARSPKRSPKLISDVPRSGKLSSLLGQIGPQRRQLVGVIGGLHNGGAAVLARGMQLGAQLFDLGRIDRRLGGKARELVLGGGNFAAQLLQLRRIG